MSSRARSVYELLQARAAEPGVARLLGQLDALSARCGLAGCAAAAASAASSGSEAAPSLPSPPLPSPRRTRQQPPGADGGGWAHAATLPGAGAPLPCFAWAPTSEHAELQAAAEAACAAFTAPTARDSWRSWAMRPASVARVLDLSWWAVAALFQPRAEGAKALRARVVRAMTRHYVCSLSGLMGRRGAAADSYLRLWAAATAAAARALLAAAFPASAAAGQLGPALEAQLRRQLRLWITGPLPGERGGGVDPAGAGAAAGALAQQESGGGGGIDAGVGGVTGDGGDAALRLMRPLCVLPEAARCGDDAGGGSVCSGAGGDGAVDLPAPNLRTAAAALRRAAAEVARAESVRFARCQPSPLMARALEAAHLPAQQLRAGRRKLDQSVLPAMRSDGDGLGPLAVPIGAGDHTAASAGAAAGEGGAAGAGTVRKAARCTAAAERCHAAARSAAGAYASRRAALRLEVLRARRSAQRRRDEISRESAAAAALRPEQRRALGSGLAGLTGAQGRAASGPPVAQTDAECKALRVRAHLEWRALDWRCEHEFRPRGRSLDMAAALAAGSAARGRAGWPAASGAAAPLQLRAWQPGSGGGGGRGSGGGGNRDTARVRTMKAARRVVEGLARDRAERGAG
ncbi:hypothetical protein Rsub_03955 [Raphidocelis subcapitata]|uniref:Uncharacterized protein n=1 Tax=Raphidocelis subcapitata TaxID=307507 RepID=A0A2V0NVJ7_9CHLO|nr:hypothetical protein Rsub_03955 [Raphidocelis subcapitata]|eukprot:GBF91651.1 hypothetical protein Rsub_03955 [Raphidocelis subcapitata]